MQRNRFTLRVHDPHNAIRGAQSRQGRGEKPLEVSAERMPVVRTGNLSRGRHGHRAFGESDVVRSRRPRCAGQPGIASGPGPRAPQPVPTCTGRTRQRSRNMFSPQSLSPSCFAGRTGSQRRLSHELDGIPRSSLMRRNGVTGNRILRSSPRPSLLNELVAIGHPPGWSWQAYRDSVGTSL